MDLNHLKLSLINNILRTENRQLLEYLQMLLEEPKGEYQLTEQQIRMVRERSEAYHADPTKAVSWEDLNFPKSLMTYFL